MNITHRSVAVFTDNSAMNPQETVTSNISIVALDRVVSSFHKKKADLFFSKLKETRLNTEITMYSCLEPDKLLEPSIMFRDEFFYEPIYFVKNGYQMMDEADCRYILDVIAGLERSRIYPSQENINDIGTEL